MAAMVLKPMLSTPLRLGTVGMTRMSWVRCMGYATEASIGEVQPWRAMHPPLQAPMLLQEINVKDIPGWQMVFLGPPGVGKGTYASRLGNLVKVPHIAMGDLVRNEISQQTAMAEYLKTITGAGELLPDEVVFNLLTNRLDNGASRGESGFILDGYPRTLNQAKSLGEVANVDLAVNLRMRDDVLVAKCLGRRMCSECGGNFNVANVNIDGIRMPAALPPSSCVSKMTTRADDVGEVVRARMRVYHEESRPVEEFYRSQGKLLNFDVRGSIPQTWSRLLSSLHLEDTKRFVPQGSQTRWHDLVKSSQCITMKHNKRM